MVFSSVVVRRNLPICLLIATVWLHLVVTPVRGFTTSAPTRRGGVASYGGARTAPGYGKARGRARGESTPRNRGGPVSMGRDGVADTKKRELLDPTRLAVLALLSLGEGIPFFTGGANKFKDHSAIEGRYSDPNHPNGYRSVALGKEAGDVVIELVDEPKGKMVVVQARVNTSTKGEEVLTMDLSPKGGPSGLKAVYREGRIEFPDGNSWARLDIKSK